MRVGKANNVLDIPYFNIIIKIVNIPSEQALLTNIDFLSVNIVTNTELKDI